MSERDGCGDRLGSPLFLPVRITPDLDLVRTRAISIPFITLEAPAMSPKITILPSAQDIWLLKTSCVFVVVASSCQQLPVFNDIGLLIAIDTRNVIVAFHRQVKFHLLCLEQRLCVS